MQFSSQANRTDRARTTEQTSEISTRNADTFDTRCNKPTSPIIIAAGAIFIA